MATKTIHAFTAITSIEGADEILAWDDSANTTRKITWANALTNATLVTPTIASFANAQHTHANAAGGGTLTGYLAATGATTGATSQAQVFTSGLGVGTSGAPATLIEASQATDGAKVRLTSRQNDSAHVTSAPYASYEIYKSDASGAGAGVASAWRAYPTTTTGAGANVAFSVNTGSAPGEVEVLFLNSSKNVGVGSASTTNKFQVYDDTYGNLIQFIPNAMNGYGFDVGGCGLIITGGTDAAGQDAGFILRNEQSNFKWVFGMDASDSDAFHISTPNFNASNILTLLSGGNMGVGVNTPTAVIHAAASTTARASLNITAGTAPTTGLAVGDIWNDGALSFYNADATTNAIVNHLRLRRNSTGTAAAGFGLGIIAELESSTTDAQSAGRLTWSWDVATHASRAAKGKLTAYYTGTEREAITWVADSSGINVGIMNAAPVAPFHVDAIATAYDATTGLAIFQDNADRQIAVGGLGFFRRDADVDDADLRINYIGYNGGTTRHRDLVVYDGKSAVMAFFDGSSKRLGLGTTAPQSLIHGHDGSGGFLFVNRAAVDGTLVTVIPDAAGDVTEKIFFVGWCTNSAPFSADVAATTLTVSSSTTKTDGTNTLTIAVTAGGAFTLQATGGAATWNVNLWVFWR